MEELSRKSGRKRYLIAESDLNDSRLIRPPDNWGYGLDAQWSDDFHHALHALLTGENLGYYSDFGTVEHLAKSIREGFYYSGNYSRFRKRRHGNFSADLPGEQFIIALQNHDQVGNRMLGERISTLISFEAQKLAAGVLLLSPYPPLIFMGQEYGEEAPFLYFVSHTDADLIAAVRKGRKEEFSEFIWKEEPPDPEAEETFERSKLDWESRKHGDHAVLLSLYKELTHMRRSTTAFSLRAEKSMDIQAFEHKKVILMRRWTEDSEMLCLFNFSGEEASIEPSEFRMKGRWERVLDSAEEKWNGPGASSRERIDPDGAISLSPLSFAVFARKDGKGGAL